VFHNLVTSSLFNENVEKKMLMYLHLGVFVTQNRRRPKS